MSKRGMISCMTGGGMNQPLVGAGSPFVRGTTARSAGMYSMLFLSVAQPTAAAASEPAIKTVRILLIRFGGGLHVFGDACFGFIVVFPCIAAVEPGEELADCEEEVGEE